MPNFNRHTVILGCILSLSALGLTACHHTKPLIAYVDPTPLSLKEQIRSQGVLIIQQGARLQLILPTDKFFRPQTNLLLPGKSHTINLIALYLKEYLQQHHTQQVITVTGYTDTVYITQQQKLLSQQYADIIASFLWNKGFEHRQLQVRGMGSTQSIASTNTAQGSGANRRVVIQINPL